MNKRIIQLFSIFVVLFAMLSVGQKCFSVVLIVKENHNPQISDNITDSEGNQVSYDYNSDGRVKDGAWVKTIYYNPSGHVYLKKNFYGNDINDVVTLQCKLSMINKRNLPIKVPYFTPLDKGVYYGTFGNQTELAVKNFQNDYALTYDGIVGNTTWNKLMELERNEFILAIGSRDDYSSIEERRVEKLQRRLEYLNYLQVPKDSNGKLVYGFFGTKTEDAINAYKRDKGLLNSNSYMGKVGETTWNNLFRNDVPEGTGYPDLPDISKEELQKYLISTGFTGEIDGAMYVEGKTYLGIPPPPGSTLDYMMHGNGEDVLGKALKQIILGNYTDVVTVEGTAGQMMLSFTGVDVAGDVRDLTYDVTNWKWSWGHAGQTGLDTIGLFPVVGALKNADEVKTLIKNARKVDDIIDTSRIATKNNYRSLYKLVNPDLPKTHQIHHTLPQKYESIMSRSGINIHELKYLRGIHEKLHLSEITKEWGRWDKSVGGNPTAQQVIDFAKKIDEKYGHYWFVQP